MKMIYKKRDRIRLLDAQPLPSGRMVRLTGLVDFIRPDGLLEIRIVTPGIYDRGIMKVRPDAVELVDTTS